MTTDRVMWSDVCPKGERRTVSHSSIDGLLEVIARARAERPSVLVLTGGESDWCYGEDLLGLLEAPALPTHLEALVHKLHEAVSSLQRLDAIVITVVDGFAAGAGVALAAAGDIVLASDAARFTLGYTKLGLSPDGGTCLLSQTLGVHRLLYAALTNPIIDATAAHRYGLVAEVLPRHQLLARARELASALATGSAGALSATKHLIRRQARPDVDDALAAERETLVDVAAHQDAIEGIGAFLSKRPPTFA